MTWYKRILYFFCHTCRNKQNRTVRQAFPLTFGALALLAALTIGSSETTYIEIVSSKNDVKAGDTVELDVYVSAHTPVNAVDITVAVPTSELEITGIDTGESVITLWTEDPYHEDGTVYLTGGTFRRGFVGKHLIATINTEAVDSGIASVNVTDSLLLAGDGTADEIETSGGTENVKLYIANEDGEFPQGVDLAGTFEASAEVNLLTDIDGDGSVSLVDVSRFMAAWQSRSTVYDFSGDGQMTFRDFAIILAHSFFR